jgi:hypothetical protein
MHAYCALMGQTVSSQAQVNAQHAMLASTVRMAFALNVTPLGLSAWLRGWTSLMLNLDSG